MTYIEQAIKIAIENGWKDWDYMPNIVIDTSDYVDFLKDWKPVEGTHLSYIILDPAFWQALGKGLGWSDATTGGIVRPRWQVEWHRFIDNLAQGGSIDDFFNDLLK